MLYLKENKHIALQIACGDILNVAVKDSNFIIKTEEQLMFDILTTNQNMKILKDALKWQGFTGDIVVNKMQSHEDKVKADLEKLEKLQILFNEV